MKRVRVLDLARTLGVSRYAIYEWIAKDPKLGVWRSGPGGREWAVNIDRLAAKWNIPLHEMYAIETGVWVKATVFARHYKLSVRSVIAWCRSNAGFARRFGNTYFINLVNYLGTHEAASVLLLEISSRAKAPK